MFSKYVFIVVGGKTDKIVCCFPERNFFLLVVSTVRLDADVYRKRVEPIYRRTLVRTRSFTSVWNSSDRIQSHLHSSGQNTGGSVYARQKQLVVHASGFFVFNQFSTNVYPGITAIRRRDRFCVFCATPNNRNRNTITKRVKEKFELLTFYWTEKLVRKTLNTRGFQHDSCDSSPVSCIPGVREVGEIHFDL